MQVKKGNEAVSIQVWRIQFPEWLLVKIKESLAPLEDDEMELPAEKAMEVPSRSYETRKLRLFIEITNVLSGDGKYDISK